MSVSFFPHEKIRDIQSELISAIDSAVKNGENLVAHAPTGLGKTAASIAPAISNTLKTSKTIFFLTSMHTQHKIALDTVREIKNKHGVQLITTNIIGKKHMCLQPGVKALGQRDFVEYCKALREEGKCSFYTNLKKGEDLSFSTKTALSELKEASPVTTTELLKMAEKHNICPYEVSMLLGKESKVIIADYYYLFHPRIRESFLRKTGKELEDAVIIVDEAHNLPGRIKNLASERITSITIKRAISEAESLKEQEVQILFSDMLGILETYAEKAEEEEYITREDFMERVRQLRDYDELIEELEEMAERTREEQKQSYIGIISSFLEAWKGNNEGFTRIFAKEKGLREEILSLNYKCMDPGVISRQVLEKAASTILMSGTLTPTYMYREVLGLQEGRTKEITLESPFPEENRLSIIIPKTSTKFTARSEEQYKEIASITTRIVNAIPGNSAVFFPSFKLRDDVYRHMRDCEKTVFVERPGLTKKEKEELLENFKSYKNSGAVLIGVISGSFGEGIDLPGDYLKGVVVVGLPLQKPDLETKAMIDYYEKKFGKGWDYGYLFPAFNKTLQSAGRCIRSETDRGVIVFLDERYEWPTYKRCFPRTWNLKVTMLYEGMIKGFFEKQ
jgi:DNA excision repair protein ERCC-2